MSNKGKLERNEDY